MARTRAFSSPDARHEVNVSFADDVLFDDGGGGGAADSGGPYHFHETEKGGSDANNKNSSTIGSNDSHRQSEYGPDVIPAASSEDLYTTEIVRAMFGPTIGSVVGDYSCTYKRNSGRMYLATNAVAFYSFFFGTESKYIFRLSEITSISKIKSSGVCLKTTSGVDHNFRSLSDRESVLQKMRQLQSSSNITRSASGTANTPAKAIAAMTSSTSNSLLSPSPDTVEPVRRFKSFSSFSNKQHTKIKKQHRRVRSRSVDALDLRERLDTGDSGSTEAASDEGECEDETEPVPGDDNMEPIKAEEKEDSANKWTRLTKDKLRETALDGVQLPCSLDSFYDKFLSDDAQFSFDKFQTQTIGDFDLELERWDKDEETKSDKRIIKFRHPLKHRMGPSSAQMEKHQFCDFVRDNGILLKGASYGKGFPAADAFHVEDMWILEPCKSGSGVTMTVLFQVVYSKGTMLKKLIDANTKQEYITMYEKYLNMVSAALGEKAEATPVDISVEAKEVSIERKEVSIERSTKAPTQQPRPIHPQALLVVVIMLLFITLLLTYYTAVLTGKIQSLEGQMDEIKEILLQIKVAQQQEH